MNDPWDSEAEMLAALEQARATLRLEDIELAPEQVELLVRRGRGELSEEQFRDLALALADRLVPSKA